MNYFGRDLNWSLIKEYFLSMCSVAEAMVRQAKNALQEESWRLDALWGRASKGGE